MALASLS